MTKLGAKRWYFITADYAFGHSLLEQFSRAAKAAGGTVVGNDMVPFPNDDFSSFLLKAQAAHADAIGILESGQDLRNAVKQAGEFGLMNGTVRLVPGQMNLTDVAALGISAWSGVNPADLVLELRRAHAGVEPGASASFTGSHPAASTRATTPRSCRS